MRIMASKGGSPFSKFAADLLRGSKTMKSKTTLRFVDILANRILVNAKKRVVVQTGALRASGRVEMGFTPTQRIVAFGGGGTNVDYAKVIEFGRFSRAPFPARPYLRPALLEEMGASRKDIKRELEISLAAYKKHYGFL